MTPDRFHLVARISSESVSTLRPILSSILPGVSVRSDGVDLVVEGDLEGSSSKDLNRSLLSALRRVEKRTRIRSQWTGPNGVTERYFDYVLKSARGP